MYQILERVSGISYCVSLAQNYKLIAFMTFFIPIGTLFPLFFYVNGGLFDGFAHISSVASRVSLAGPQLTPLAPNYGFEHDTEESLQPEEALWGSCETSELKLEPRAPLDHGFDNDIRKLGSSSLRIFREGSRRSIDTESKDPFEIINWLPPLDEYYVSENKELVHLKKRRKAPSVIKTPKKDLPEYRSSFVPPLTKLTFSAESSSQTLVLIEPGHEPRTIGSTYSVMHTTSDLEDSRLKSGLNIAAHYMQVRRYVDLGNQTFLGGSTSPASTDGVNTYTEPKANARGSHVGGGSSAACTSRKAGSCVNSVCKPENPYKKIYSSLRARQSSELFLKNGF